MAKFLTADEYFRKRGFASAKDVMKRRVKFTDASEILESRKGRDGASGRDGRDGKDGMVGPQGPAGTPGRDGAGFSWKGNWLGSVSYNSGDVVNYLGSSYVAIAPSKGDYPNKINNNWDLMSAAGASGARGPQGDVVSIGAPTFIQDTQPSYEGSYVWVQTGLGADGTDYTVWYNIC